MIRRIVPDRLVTDMAASTRFYTEVVGLEVAMDLGWVVTLVSPDQPTAQVILMTHDASAPVAPDISVETDDVDAAHERALAQGHEVVHPLTDEPWGVRRFFVRTPDGTVVNVLQHTS